MHQSEHPFVYEVNVRARINELRRITGQRVTLADVPDWGLDRIARAGVDYLWLMGVWQGGPKARQRALQHQDLKRAYDAALPGWTDADVQSSPYAVADYKVDDDLGGPDALAHLRGRLSGRGIGLLLDFVPNHLGLDHAWVQSHPERFVRDQAGEIAHGRDPFFPPWDDTVQLDHRRRDTRDALVDELRRVAEQCDGVRCDMAMLVLRDVFTRTWGGTWEGGELWSAAIQAVRQTQPRFLFAAEAYWDLEYRLQQLGFDYTYDKRLYDRLARGDVAEIAAHLRADESFQRRSVRFVENHDEPRAAAVWPPERRRAAAVAAMTLPGMRLLHDGQLEGRLRRMPVQLGRWPEEVSDPDLLAFYERLLGSESVRRGAWRLLDLPAPVMGWTWDAARFGQSCAVVNYSDAPRAISLRLPLMGISGRRVQLVDRLSGDERAVDGDELFERGVPLDLAPWDARLFELR